MSSAADDLSDMLPASPEHCDLSAVCAALATISAACAASITPREPAPSCYGDISRYRMARARASSVLSASYFSLYQAALTQALPSALLESSPPNRHSALARASPYAFAASKHNFSARAANCGTATASFSVSATPSRPGAGGGTRSNINVANLSFIRERRLESSGSAHGSSRGRGIIAGGGGGSGEGGRSEPAPEPLEG